MNKALITLRCEYCGQEKTVWEGGDIGRCYGCGASVWSEDKSKRVESKEEPYRRVYEVVIGTSSTSTAYISSGSYSFNNLMGYPGAY